MFQGMKKLRELRKEAREIEAEYDRAGKELIRMQVKEDSGFLSPYCLQGEPVVSSEVSDFLDNVVKRLPLRAELHIEIDGDTIDEQERTEYAAAIRNHYRSQVIDTGIKLKRNAVTSLIMAIIAVAILTVYVALELYSADYVLLEIIDIAAWVFMWEAVDLFFLERRAIKLEQLRDCRLYSAEVTFLG